MASQQLNLLRNANQAQLVGNTGPPNMARVPENVLNAASSGGFNLLNTKSDTTASDRASAACRAYKDITGLRQLQKDQINKTHYQPGCGWRYKPSNGINPEISQGAFGTAEGPINGVSGSPDEVSGGTQWFWDLNTAEKNISAKTCANASKCSQLGLLGRYTEVCGFCKSSGAMIPVVKSASGTLYTARYPKDRSLMCATSDIVTANTGKCPPAISGFVGTTKANYEESLMPNSTSLPQHGRGDLNEAFKPLLEKGGRGNNLEGFAPQGGAYPKRGNPLEGFANLTLNDLDQCLEPPLSRDCVVLSARMAGCSDEGTLISALKASGSGDYDSVLKVNPVFTAYKSVATPGITNATLKDGSVALQTALDDFGNLVRHSQSANPKLGLSARDLCVRKGAFDAYDFCSEITVQTVISNTNIKCVQQDWQTRGGTPQGSGYPTIGDWAGKTYQQYLTYANTIMNNMKSQDKMVNSMAIKQFIGSDTSTGDLKAAPLPMNENTRGAETVWFDLVNVSDPNSVPVVLYCDLRMSKDKSVLNGEVLPSFKGWQELKSKYNFPTSDNRAYTSAFEVRSTVDERMKFAIGTDDGCMVSLNQNPFEGTQHKGNDWGSWRYQGPTPYESGFYPVRSEKTGGTNMIVTKWFNGYGQAYSEFNIWRQSTGWREGRYSEVYLTQEPLAPWMQFEVCTRPNNGRGNATGFFEKRFNGPSAFFWGNGKPFPSFDVDTKSVVYQTDPNMRGDVPGKKPFMTFTSSSWWHTLSHYHVNAFKTLTLLVRPNANLANGSTAPLFYQTNQRTFIAGCYIMNNNGQYVINYSGKAFDKPLAATTVPIKMNEWNFIVIQYLGDNMGLRKITFHIETLARLQDATVRSQFSATLRANQNISGPILIGAPGSSNPQNSGWFMLGAATADFYKKPGMWQWGTPGFSGDVAWVHGFRNFLDTEALLTSEIKQTWISRWPRGNLDGEAGIKATCTFDALEYSDMYPDLQNAFRGNVAALTDHYKTYGINEGRSPCGRIDATCKFDSETYYNLHPDVRAARMDAKAHFKTYGMNEKRAVCSPK
jgi:hypothetical protein